MANALEQAIVAIKAGDKDTGKRLLAETLRVDPRNETAWLWMTAVVDSDDQRRKFLEQVIAINPNNDVAQRALAKLGPQASLPINIQSTPPPQVPPRSKRLMQIERAALKRSGTRTRNRAGPSSD